MKTTVEQLADELYLGAKKAGRIKRKPANINAWYRQLKKLLASDKNAESIIRYTIAHLADPFMPWVASPTSLAAKWPQLAKRWSAHVRYAHEDQDLKEVWEALSHLNWPCEDAEVQASLNRSLINLRDLRKRLLIALMHAEDPCLPMLITLISPVREVAWNWYLELWRSIQGWEAFNGDLVPFEFNVENARTLRWLQLRSHPQAQKDQVIQLLHQIQHHHENKTS